MGILLMVFSLLSPKPWDREWESWELWESWEGVPPPRVRGGLERGLFSAGLGPFAESHRADLGGDLVRAGPCESVCVRVRPCASVFFPRGTRHFM